MRILMVNKYYSVRGGADRVFFETADLLRARGHTVIPFSTVSDHAGAPSEYADYFLRGVEYASSSQPTSLEKIKLALRGLYNPNAGRMIAALIRDTHPNIAHLHNLHYEISSSIFQALHQARIAVVHTLHDYRLICPNGYLFTEGRICERCAGGAYYHAIVHRCLRQSLGASLVGSARAYLDHALGITDWGVDLFISPSQFLRYKMIQAGIPDNKIEHIPNFVAVDGYTPNYKPGDYIVWLGHLVPQKGVHMLLQAMKQVGSARLCILGDGPLRPNLERFTAHEGLNHVEFMGFVRGDRLWKTLAGAAFIVCPSQWYENSPMVIYESFALGKPVIASDIGGVSELVRSEETGLLFPPGDTDALAWCINRPLAHPELIIEWGWNARRLVETHYDSATHYDRLMRAYTTARDRAE